MSTLGWARMIPATRIPSSQPRFCSQPARARRDVQTAARGRAPKDKPSKDEVQQAPAPKQEDAVTDLYGDLMHTVERPTIRQAPAGPTAWERAQTQDARDEMLQASGLYSVGVMLAQRDVSRNARARELKSLQREADPDALAQSLAAQGFDLEADWADQQAGHQGPPTTTGRALSNSDEGVTLQRPPSNPKEPTLAAGIQVDMMRQADHDLRTRLRQRQRLFSAGVGRGSSSSSTPPPSGSGTAFGQPWVVREPAPRLTGVQEVDQMAARARESAFLLANSAQMSAILGPAAMRDVTLARQRAAGLTAWPADDRPARMWPKPDPKDQTDTMLEGVLRMANKVAPEPGLHEHALTLPRAAKSFSRVCVTMEELPHIIQGAGSTRWNQVFNPTIQELSTLKRPSAPGTGTRVPMPQVDESEQDDVIAWLEGGAPAPTLTPERPLTRPNLFQTASPPSSSASTARTAALGAAARTAGSARIAPPADPDDFEALYTAALVSAVSKPQTVPVRKPALSLSPRNNSTPIPLNVMPLQSKPQTGKALLAQPSPALSSAGTAASVDPDNFDALYTAALASAASKPQTAPVRKPALPPPPLSSSALIPPSAVPPQFKPLTGKAAIASPNPALSSARTAATVRTAVPAGLDDSDAQYAAALASRSSMSKPMTAPVREAALPPPPHSSSSYTPRPPAALPLQSKPLAVKVKSAPPQPNSAPTTAPQAAPAGTARIAAAASPDDFDAQYTAALLSTSKPVAAPIRKPAQSSPTPGSSAPILPSRAGPIPPPRSKSAPPRSVRQLQAQPVVVRPPRPTLSLLSPIPATEPSVIAVEPSPTGTEDSAADIVAAVGLLEQQFEYARARAALQAAPSGLAKQPLPTQPIARRPEIAVHGLVAREGQPAGPSVPPPLPAQGRMSEGAAKRSPATPLRNLNASPISPQAQAIVGFSPAQQAAVVE